VKLGWALGGLNARPARDERFFDARHRDWVNSNVGFMYCPAGRTLDDKRPNAAPYLVIDPARRLLLSPDEPIEDKLAAAAQTSERAKRAVRSHMRRIVAAYSREVTPLSGPLPQRMRGVLRHIFESSAPRSEPRPLCGEERCS
jgi:hypothetical protein